MFALRPTIRKHLRNAPKFFDPNEKRRTIETMAGVHTEQFENKTR